MRILVVDDEPSISQMLCAQLTARGNEVEVASCGSEGLLRAAEFKPDLVLLDVGLPDITGIEVCHRLRDWSQVPVIFLTVHDAERIKVRALDSGGDDYITKPFGVPELLARIRAVRRRTQEASQTGEAVFNSGRLTVDFVARSVMLDQNEVRLTPTEYELLRFFIQHAGRTLTHRELLTEVWGPQASRSTQYLHVFIRQLRRKLEQDPAQPRLIVTEPGVGYRLRVEQQQPAAT